ncbi:MAG: hypothetical protein GC200_06960 [Tepidisphaera sp.]|nr:hypothetical protein [Tepidisphaera sp.]
MRQVQCVIQRVSGRVGSACVALAACAGLVMLPTAAVGQTCTAGFQHGDGYPGLGGLGTFGNMAPSATSAVNWDPDGDGPLPEVLVVLGGFSSVDGVLANGVAMWNGREWHAIGGGLAFASSTGTAGTSALAVLNGELYAAGQFKVASSDPSGYARVAKWNGTSWTQVGANLSGAVTSLAAFNGELFVGGQFSIGNLHNFAKLSGGNWVAVGPQVPPPGAIEDSSRRVDSLAVQGEWLLIGGTFSQYLIRQDAGGNRSLVGPPLAAQFSQSGGVTSIYASGADVYIAGGFRLATGTSPGAMHWDGTAWTAMPAPSTSGIYRIGSLNSTLYLTPSGLYSPNTLLRWDGQGWIGVNPADAFAGNGLAPEVQIIGAFQDHLVLGGSFSGVYSAANPVNQYPRLMYGLAWMDAAEHVTPISRGLGGRVMAFAEFQGKTIAAGRFVTIGTSGNGPQAPGTPGHLAEMGEDGFWAPFAGGLPDNNIWAATSYENQLIIGGEPFNVGGVTNALVAGWDGASWHDMSAGATAIPLRLVSAGSELWGAFSTSGSQYGVTRLGRWNGAAWDVYPMRVGFLGDARMLRVGAELFATDADASRIVRLTASGPEALPLPEFETDVRAFGGYQGELLGVSGDERLYRWNGAGWTSAGSLPPTVRGQQTDGSYAESSGVMYLGVGGSGVYDAGRVVSWDGHAWGITAGLSLNPAYPTGIMIAGQGTPLVTSHGEHEVFVGGAFESNRFDAIYSPAKIPAAYFGRIETPSRAVTLEAPPATLVRDAGQSVDLTWTLSATPTRYFWSIGSTALTDGAMPGVGVVSGATTGHLRIDQLEPAATGLISGSVRDACEMSLYLAPTYLFVNPPCDPDLNNDGVVDAGDVDYLINVIAGGDNPENVDTDFNHDGVADQTDVDALINAVAGGGCP